MIDFLAFLMVSSGIAANIPQIIKIIETKSSKDISPGTYFLVMMSCAFGAIYSLLRCDLWFLLSNVSSFGLCFVVIVLYYRFRR